MSKTFIRDFCSYVNDQEIIEIIGKETLYYSNKISKINSYGISQEREIILTNEALYNFQKKKLKRKMNYIDILGISYSKESNEFVIHGDSSEYDYQYSSIDKFFIIYIIAKFYGSKLNKHLKIYEINDKSLKNYVTTKKDKKKDKNFSRIDTKFLIDTQTFLIDYDPNDNIKKRHHTMFNFSEEKERFNEVKSNILFSKHKNIKSVSFEDFEILKVIGKGNMGKVYLVQHKETKEYYSLKSVKINSFEGKEIFQTSIKIIENLDYPFLVGVTFCFKTKERIYFIMPLIQGEELSHYMNTTEPFDEDKAKFYLVLIGMTLEYLHTHGIIYREINPQSILIDKDGYLKIIDFHLDKIFKIKMNSNTLYKNTEYFAPEIICNNDEKSSADWWTYGIILYEMLCGIPPFYSDKEGNMREFIIKNELRFPQNNKLSENAKDLIKKLVKKNDNERLGFQNGFNEIAKHPFFENFDFHSIHEKKVIPPYKPKIDLINDEKEKVFFTKGDLIQNGVI